MPDRTQPSPVPPTPSDKARPGPPSAASPCDGCPERPGCKATCARLEAILPQMGDASLHLFTEIFGLPLAVLVARRERVRMLLDYRDLLSGMGLTERIFNDFYNSGDPIEIIAARHGIGRNAAVWQLTRAHRRIMGARRLALLTYLHPRSPRAQTKARLPRTQAPRTSARRTEPGGRRARRASGNTAQDTRSR